MSEEIVLNQHKVERTRGWRRVKLVTFGEGAGRVGVLEGEEIAVLDVPTMREYFERGGADETGERVALADTRLRAPIIPKKFFHTAGNFREHKTESENVNWAHDIAPWINFFQNVDAIVGPDEPVIYPEHLTEELDYELELAVVLKKAGKWFSAEEAMDYIGGYVIFNDLTARDIQRGEMRSGVFSFCKAIDTFCPLGPWIVTPDEIPDPRDLEMELRVNGEVRQESHSGNMSVTIERDPLQLLRASATPPATCSRPGRSRAWRASSRPRSARCSTSSRATSSRPRSSTSACCGTRSSRGRRATARRRCPACGPGVRALTDRRRDRELAARRREARPRPLADARPRARRARRPRSRQRPLPDELLGDEGLRRRRLPGRGRAGADLPRAVARGCRAHGLDERSAALRRLRRARPAAAVAAGARPRCRARRAVRGGRHRALARHAGDRPHGGRADDLPEGVVRRVPGTRRMRRRCSTRRGC